eukprot:7734218-Lingulodinium_polyedra.AAC.1
MVLRDWLKAEARRRLPRRRARASPGLPPLPPGVPRPPTRLQRGSVSAATLNSYTLLWTEL